MQVTLKYNKNTQKVTFVDDDGCCEYRAMMVREDDDEISMIVMHEINPELLEEPIRFKSENFDEIIDTE